MKVVSRAEWRARWPRSTTLLDLPVSQVFFALTNTWPCTYPATCAEGCRRMQRANLIVGQDIRYNFIIGGDGLVYEGRGWDATPSLDYGYEDQEDTSIYIGCIGKNKSPNNELTFKLLQDFIDIGVEMKCITEDFTLQFIQSEL